MKKVIKVLLGIVVVISCMAGIFLYEFKYRVHTVDSQQYSWYTIELQSVGEPLFFGNTPCRVVLKRLNHVINKMDLRISDDGGSLKKDNWSVSWFDDHVSVVMKGKEQDPVKYSLSFNEKKTTITQDINDAEETNEDMHGNDATDMRKELKMVADYLGLKDISYEISAKGRLYLFARVDENTTRHIEFNPNHDNEYVYQESNKETGTKILGFYKIENGQVIDEHTTTWH